MMMASMIMMHSPLCEWMARSQSMRVKMSASTA
jgi:hypothetical protein